MSIQLTNTTNTPIEAAELGSRPHRSGDIAATFGREGVVRQKNAPSHPFQWHPPGVRATIDKAGRLVVPKQLRDHLGLRPGTVEAVADGAALRVEPITGADLDERQGRLVIPAGGVAIDDVAVQALRHADQK